ncbi:MAG: hypothetical protein IPL26_13375 [Leptospiraceae bacterium]|nr:hypothetical protein [Leptospiraceae bacterium]
MNNLNEKIVSLSTILSEKRGTDIDTEYFKNLKHDTLLDEVISLFEINKSNLGYSQIQKMQSLNDHGVDILMHFGEIKIGFQIKSHFDVTENNFAANVKRQISESYFHGIKKLYLLICAPINDDSNNYQFRISHLVNEISSYKFKYISVFEPQEIILQLKNKQLISNDVIQRMQSNYIFDEVSNDEIKKMLNLLLAGNVKISNPNQIQRIKKKASNLKKLYRVLKWTDIDEEMNKKDLEMFNNLLDDLEDLNPLSLDFLSISIQKSQIKKISYYQELKILPKEIELELSLSPKDVMEQIAILGKKFKISIDDDSEGLDYIFIGNYSGIEIFVFIKNFCDKIDIKVKDIITNLNFELFDE